MGNYLLKDFGNAIVEKKKVQCTFKVNSADFFKHFSQFEALLSSESTQAVKRSIDSGITEKIRNSDEIDEFFSKIQSQIERESTASTYREKLKLDPKDLDAWNELGYLSDDRNEREYCKQKYKELKKEEFYKKSPIVIQEEKLKTLTKPFITESKNNPSPIRNINDPEILVKLKKLVKVSKSLKIGQMAEILNLDQKALYEKIVDWAIDYGFTLDQDVIEFGAGNKDAFMVEIDHAFAQWGENEKNKEGKQ